MHSTEMKLPHVLVLILALSAGGLVIGDESESDPYLWLEDVQGKESLAWVEERNARTVERLTAHPRYQEIYDDTLKDLTASDENRRRQEVQQRLGRKEAVHPTPFNAWELTAGFPVMLIGWCHRLGRKLDMDKIARATGPLTSGVRNSRGSSPSPTAPTGR